VTGAFPNSHRRFRIAIHDVDSQRPHYNGTFRRLTRSEIAVADTAAISLRTDGEKRMINRQPETFDPEYVSTLRRILDIAVEKIAEENRTPATKAKMAQTIVRDAAGGITDAGILVSRAVHAGATPAA
jgi:hypothetical protein